MKILAIIPARGGSKRLPNKNVLDLNGKPLIKWTIEAALGCNEIDTVMVSTDSSNIADIAIQAGAEVPYLRSAELSSDTASSSDVVLNVINYYESIGNEFDVVILLQPTSPLRTTNDIKNAIKLFEEKKANSIVSVTECEHSPLWCNTLQPNLKMDNFIPDGLKNIRSQDLPKYFRLNGAIYLVNVKKFIEAKTFILNNTYALMMPQINSVDIDSLLDFKYAEIIMEYNSSI